MRCWLSCGDQIVGCVLVPGFEKGITLGGGVGCGKERKEGLLFGAVSCWAFCGNQRVNV